MRLERTPEIKLMDWVQKVTVASDITLRSRLVTFLLCAYGGLLAGTNDRVFSQWISDGWVSPGRIDYALVGRGDDWRNRRPMGWLTSLR